jgi:glycosyltransferase involved in cell wall biosynthesis
MDPSKGGLSQGLRNTIPELEKLHVHNEVVSLDDSEAFYLGKDSFKIHALGAKGPWVYSKKLIPWLLNNLNRFDIVLVHGLWLYPSHATTKAFRLFKKKFNNIKDGSKELKLFVMPHGMLDPYFQEAKGRELKALRNWIYWKIIEGKVINQANGLLFTCETELQLARKPFRPYHPKREINVGFGIENPPPYTKEMREAFHQNSPEVKDEPYLLFLSRIHPKKGVDLLINAYLQNLLDKKVKLPKLIIAGPGLETSYGKKILNLVNNTPALREVVFFTGMLTGDAKWGAFYECEAFILPSHQENFGIAVVEAMACGKPVLISNQVNIWNEIHVAGAGIIAPNTQDGTEQLLKDWISLPLESKKVMEERAKFTFQKEFAISSAANRLLQATTE